MRKAVQETQSTKFEPEEIIWLDLASIATAELSSEDPQHPIEDAFQEGTLAGFRASSPGMQHIKLTFDRPQVIRRIRVEFHEEAASRSQEFALFTTSAGGSRREFVRQQWTFSPDGSRDEIEDYAADLQDVLILELIVDPGRHDENQVVTLKALQVA